MLKNKSILPRVIVILGPTASGKSDLAIKLAKKFDGEIISADSRQIYRSLNIGSGKITKKEMQGIPHHLIDIKNPNQDYTVAEYKRDCLKVIKKVLHKNKLPILIGGTGLYIKAVIDNLEIPEVKPNPDLRKKLEKELKEKGLNYLYEKLIKLDPEAAHIIDKYNPRRVIRALEITLQTKKPFSAQRKQGEKLFNALQIGINVPSEKLKERIEKRVNQMVKKGLVREVENLLKKYPAELPVFDAIGYREIINYLKDTDKYGLKLINTDISINQLNQYKSANLKEVIELIKKNTWQYAKRQMTWFKKDKEIHWIRNKREAFRLLGLRWF